MGCGGLVTDVPRRWYDMVRADAGDSAVIRIFGDIGESWFGDSVSAASFADDLDGLGGDVRRIQVRLNSPGGDMFDGVAIFNTLRNHQARVEVHVDGLAASAASLIAMAGDEVVMGLGTQLMIHDAWAFFMGNADEMRRQAGVMDQLSGSMADIYADRAGGTPGEWRAAMLEETWYGAQEAVDAGLADRVVRRDGDNAPDSTEVAAMLRRSRVAARYRYQGRAVAPPPHTPARAGGSESEGSRSVVREITDEDFAVLRTRLGLGEDAEFGDVLDALEDRGSTEETTEQVAAALPDGVLAVDRDTWQQVQADAALGRQARDEQVQARRVALVQAAIDDRRILPSRRQHWLTQLAADEEGVSATLATLTPVFATVEMGYDSGGDSVSAENTLEGVRASAAYQNWKVI